jgi:hypothetical protein
MKPITILLVALFIMVTTTVQAATLDSKESARKLTDQVMAKVASGNFDGGLALMKPYLIIPESEFNVMLDKVKLQLPAIQGRFGNSIGSEFISDKMIGKSLLQIIQIQKFERHVMRWRFIFYNPTGKWVLNTFNFDDKIQSLFEE